MTDVELLAAASAFWLGVLTSLSPCSLATNVAAISYIGRRVGAPRVVLASGLLYALGRSAAYVVLAALLVSGLLSAPGVALLLQRHMPKFLGPLLILLGMVLLELITFGSFSPAVGEQIQQRVAGWGIWGAGLLGIIFALTFCPVSAALFFGSLIPLALRCNSALGLPSLYGMGTGLPVLVFALLVACGARSVSQVFNCVAHVERWARRATGVGFLLLGFYLSLRHIYGLDI